MSPIEWIQANDRRLWVERPRVRDAWKDCQEATGQKLSLQAFRELRDEHCEYWFQMRFGRIMRTTALTSRQWDRVGAWLRENWEAICGQDEDFIVRLMRSAGVPANRSILAGSSTYMELNQSGRNGPATA